MKGIINKGIQEMVEAVYGTEIWESVRSLAGCEEPFFAVSLDYPDDMTLALVKAVSDVFAPLAGTITEVNAKLSDNPELVNQEPYSEGLLFKMKVKQMDELKELLDQKKYEEYLQGIAGE